MPRRSRSSSRSEERSEKKRKKKEAKHSKKKEKKKHKEKDKKSKKKKKREEKEKAEADGVPDEGVVVSTEKSEKVGVTQLLAGDSFGMVEKKLLKPGTVTFFCARNSAEPPFYVGPEACKRTAMCFPLHGSYPTNGKSVLAHSRQRG